MVVATVCEGKIFKKKKGVRVFVPAKSKKVAAGAPVKENKQFCLVAKN